MKTTLLLLLLAPSFLFAAPVSEGWRGIPSEEFKVGAFPEEGSAAFDKDFEILLESQETRTQEQCRQAQRMKWPHFSVLFKSEILDVAEMELVTPLMNKVKSFTERVTVYHKNNFQRPRPYDANKKVKPCVQKPPGNSSKSYPSSHASISSAISCVLVEIFPDKEKDLKVFGKELGDLRFVVGVHHPSDVKAGQKLGQEICDRLMSEPDFKEEVRELKKAAAFNQN